MEKITYLNLPNCYRLSNNTIEVIVTTDVGPRVIRYGFVGGENVFAEVPELATLTEWDDWKPRGGHRLWVAPEEMPRSYAPDDAFVHYEIVDERTIRLMQRTDRAGFEKEITVSLAAEGSGVTLHHKITNRNSSGVEAAPWAMTIMRAGGESPVWNDHARASRHPERRERAAHNRARGESESWHLRERHKLRPRRRG